MKPIIVHVSSRTLALLAAAARELGIPVWRHASLCASAAARLWRDNRATTAMPAADTSGANAPADMELFFDEDVERLLVAAAASHRLPLEAQIRAALDAAIKNYEPPIPEKVRSAFGGGGAAVPAGPGGVPRRAPFDPKNYLRGPTPAPAARRTSVTAALMGDPGHGPSISAERAGRSAGGFVMPSIDD